MKVIFFLVSTLLLLNTSNLIAQQAEKIPLNHSVYNDWKTLKSPEISDNGQWCSFEINPLKGDGWLHIRNLQTLSDDSIPRGYNAQFSPTNNYIAFKIKPPYDTIKNLKLKLKEKNIQGDALKDRLPKDSLGILLLKPNLNLIKFPTIKSFKIPEENSDWMAFQYEKVNKNDTTKNDSEEPKTEENNNKKYNPKKNISTQKLKEKINATNLVIYNPIKNKQYTFIDVTEYVISNNGSHIAFITIKTDSNSQCSVITFDTKKEISTTLFSEKGICKKLCIDTAGNQVAFIYSADTTEYKTYSVYYSSQQKKAICIVDTANASLPKTWAASENSDVYFSPSGKRLFFGTAPKPVKPPKDTLLDDEKIKLDIWNWKDSKLQSEQLHDLKEELKRTYLAVYSIKENKTFQLGTETIKRIKLAMNGDANYAIGLQYAPYEHLASWEGTDYYDIFLIDLTTGIKTFIKQKHDHYAELSSTGKFLLYFNTLDSAYYSYNLISKQPICLTKNLNVKFYNELNDRPEYPDVYGIAGWTKNDKYVLIYDRFDIWKIDPTAKEKPINLTNQYGRNKAIELRYIALNKKEPFVDLSNILLHGINQNNYDEGFYRLIVSEKKIQPLIVKANQLNNLTKARKNDIVIWRKESFTEYPDLWTSDVNFTNIKKISNTNPQQSKYLWGTAELVNWISYDGNEMKGILYKPENFDATKKYPMITFYYERWSDQIHKHYIPGPIRSYVRFPVYTSNGYVIFVPDVTFRTGNPGDCSYEDVISGVRSIIAKGFIDTTRMGLQGQSWGGYQTAYLVTKTNMFRAAMAGAPVSNMTSAYGGIRWESGVSRMFQYEYGQSRLGVSLWDSLELFIKNSPLFSANKINTPLLIMANDNDGAVPWYQGIELFTALRRLGKPVWMLVYNNEEHNLERLPNCEDLTIRMMQFFDYYLKDAPIPAWMEYGIPATQKGKTLGYELIKK